MERYIADRWDDDKLQAIATRFGTTLADLSILDGFESFIYKFEHAGDGRILRVAHSYRRSPNLIHGEIDWLNYLANGGAHVARAVPSENGNLIEALVDGYGQQFLATAFLKAPGQHLAHKDWTPAFVQHYGETIGRIHRLSKDYQPSNPDWQRLHWHDPAVVDLDKWAQTTEPAIMSTARSVMRRLKSLTPDDSYHMLHHDAHGANFYVDDAGQITLFDFDDCLYGYAIDDIAMVLFYSPIRDNPAAAQPFTSDFLTGYARENTLDPKWLAHVADFMKLREIELYTVIERDIDWRNNEDPWAQNFMKGRYERLLNAVPVVDFDFTSLAAVLI